MKKLAIITTHPIQYNAPWFKLLSERESIRIKVFYTWSQTENENKFDPGFGKTIEWDIPLLKGYDYTFIKNISKKPGSKSFKGIDNPTLIDEIERWNPDNILVFGWRFKSHLKALKYFKGKIPVLFRGDSTLLDKGFPLRDRIRRKVLRYVFSHIDYALYAGIENKKYFLSAGLKENQLIRVPHAIDNDRFGNSEFVKPEDFPEKKATSLTFLFSGKLESKKDPKLLLEAFDGLNEHEKLIVVGNGPLENELKSEFQDNRNIHFIDFQNQKVMPSVYKYAEVFILPSRGPGETWGLAVNEAMACRRAVLVSDRCGCAADLVENGKNGFSFRSGNVEDLRKKMRMIIQRKDDLEQMGSYSYQKIQDWSFERIVETIENLILYL